MREYICKICNKKYFSPRIAIKCFISHTKKQGSMIQVLGSENRLTVGDVVVFENCFEYFSAPVQNIDEKWIYKKDEKEKGITGYKFYYLVVEEDTKKNKYYLLTKGFGQLIMELPSHKFVPKGVSRVINPPDEIADIMGDILIEYISNEN